MNLKRSELLYLVALIPVDAVMILLSFLIAYHIRANESFTTTIYMVPISDYFKLILMIIPGWIIIFALSRLYNFHFIKRAFDEFIGILIAVTAGVLLMVAIFFLVRTLFFSRLVLVYSWLAAIVLISIGRVLLRLIRIYFFSKKIGVKKVIIIGSGEIAQKLIYELAKPYSGSQVIGIINGTVAKQVSGIPVLGDTSQIKETFAHRQIDEVIQADSRLSDRLVSDLIDICSERGINFRFAPNLFEVLATANVNVETVGGIPVIEVKSSRLDGWGRIAKRFIDILISAISLIILSPIILIIALTVKLSSRGPVIYKSTRIGKNEKPFWFYKFRSMYTEYSIGKDFGGQKAEQLYQELLKKKQEKGVLFAIEDDPRVTKVGKFIRKTRLDEIPSIYNVLKGDMSLVGPRPHIPEEVEKFEKQLRRRFVVKPGLTGLWQISGQHDLNQAEWTRLELYYIENWSPLLDTYIVLKTIGVIFKGSPRD